ncbi:MAG TPA: ATP-binding protein, partial [Candidatus Saccharimonadales bacterium]|nr:ATP-binding protein [Candidatus Saccharimonadales bacterium]
KASSEDNLRFEEQEVLAEALFSSIGDGAIATDEFGKITRINPTALRILGYTEKEMLGSWFPKKIVALTENETPINLIDRPITKAFLTGRTITQKTYYRKKNGQKIPVAVTVSPIMLTNKPVGAIEVFRDITIEYEIDRMKSDFISLASHQLRTPLSAIKTYSHMLLDGYMGDINDAQRKSLRTILSAANRMNELISTLLNVTRIESGTITITPKTVNVEKIAEEVNKEHGLLASDKNISLSVERHSRQPCLVKTDTLILKEVLSNLISNGIKYTPEGGSVGVEIKPRRSDILIGVHDTGLGIPKYSQNNVFTKFFRAHNVVKQETSGTGLGLYLVKGLLESLGGKIWFESTEGKGTSFFFTLPKHIQASPAARLPVEEAINM